MKGNWSHLYKLSEQIDRNKFWIKELQDRLDLLSEKTDELEQSKNKIVLELKNESK